MYKYIFILLLSSSIFAKEVYYLDNNPLLLYKIINWWSIETQKDNTKPCNKAIKVTSDSLKFNYNKKNKTLTIKLKPKFPKKIKVINKKYILENIFTDKNYFRKEDKKEISNLDKFIFNNISYNTYKKIKPIQNDIIIQIEGHVKGLLAHSAKISLNYSGDFLRSCPKINQKNQSTFIKFINKKNDTILSTYKIIY